MSLVESRYKRIAVSVSGGTTPTIYQPPSNEYFAILLNLVVVAKSATAGAEIEGDISLQDDAGNNILGFMHFLTDQTYYNDKFTPSIPVIIMPYMKIVAWANANISTMKVFASVVEVYNPLMASLLQYELAEEY